MPAAPTPPTRQSPFPWTTNQGKVIVDERCQCGALRSKHEDLFGGRVFGHGACPVTHCEKYRWASHVEQESK